MSSLNLEDMWRKLHPEEKQFTWRNKMQIRLLVDI